MGRDFRQGTTFTKVATEYDDVGKHQLDSEHETVQVGREESRNVG